MKNLKTICYRSFKIEQQKASDGKLRALPPPRNSRLKVRIEVRFFWHTLTIRHSSENLALHHRIHESSLHGSAPLQRQLVVSRVPTPFPHLENPWSQCHQPQVGLPARNDRGQLGIREHRSSNFSSTFYIAAAAWQRDPSFFSSTKSLPCHHPPILPPLLRDNGHSINPAPPHKRKGPAFRDRLLNLAPSPTRQSTKQRGHQAWTFSEKCRLPPVSPTSSPSKDLCHRWAHVDTIGARNLSPPPPQPNPFLPSRSRLNPHRMTKCFTPRDWLNFESQVKKHLWGPQKCRSCRQIYRHLFIENYNITSAAALISLTFPRRRGASSAVYM